MSDKDKDDANVFTFPQSANYTETIFKRNESSNYRPKSSPAEVAALVIGLILFAAILCASAIYLSRHQERGKRRKIRGKVVFSICHSLFRAKSNQITHTIFLLFSATACYETKGKELASGLTTRKWNLQETVRTCGVDRTEEDGSDSSDSDEQPPPAPESARVAVPLGSSDTDGKPSQQPASFKHLYECQICAVEFQEGDSIYQSNNPKCNHPFHQACMDKWLNYQYSCPLCSEIYVLPTY